ncbi:MAG: CDP-alcohol phosphatidyltransferase family protein [Deltaproteobacteria bacterium]|nr:CDP-alcohol phosphatidyltransferase family protein [Deltaproteobacteria bacterium]
MFTRMSRWGSPIVLAIAKLPILSLASPNTITVFGFIFSLGAGISLVARAYGCATLLLLLSYLCDVVDGALARQRRLTSSAGTVLDSLVDRYADFVMGLAVCLTVIDGAIWMVICCLSIFGSLMVSYTSAQARLFGLVIPFSWMKRFDRSVIVFFGISGCFLADSLSLSDPRMPMKVAILFLALGTNVSALIRSHSLFKSLKIQS